MKLSYLLVEVDWALLNLHFIRRWRWISALVQRHCIISRVHRSRYISTSCCEFWRLIPLLVSWSCQSLTLASHVKVILYVMYETLRLCPIGILILQELMLSMEVTPDGFRAAVFGICLHHTVLTHLDMWLMQLRLLLPSKSCVVCLI